MKKSAMPHIVSLKPSPSSRQEREGPLPSLKDRRSGSFVAAKTHCGFATSRTHPSKGKGGLYKFPAHRPRQQELRRQPGRALRGALGHIALSHAPNFA